MICFHNLILNYSYIDNTEQQQQQQEDDSKSRITVSKQFKDKVVKPILKVKILKIQLII